jgi:hypothetical protein
VQVFHKPISIVGLKHKICQVLLLFIIATI